VHLPEEVSAVRLAQDLIRLNTVNPPGNEAQAIDFVGAVLERIGFSVETYKMSEQRTSLIADLPGQDGRPPLCFTGHLDTVGLGTTPWSVDPFGGEIRDGKIYGRGSTDMKGGIAAIIAAAAQTRNKPRSGLKLVFTAGEETGCEGAQHLVNLGVLGKTRAIVVAEPTSNKPLIGHRGALWLTLKVPGKSAHGSTPERGENAVVKAANIISELGQFGFDAPIHEHLGGFSLNIGYCHGGDNINVVPDRAEIGIDVRTTPNLGSQEVKRKIASISGDAQTTAIMDLSSVCTDPDNDWFRKVVSIVESVSGSKITPAVAPYFTDASVLAPAYGNPPLVILGPGDMELAHCVDEYCDTRKIEEAVKIYAGIMTAD
jgi:succinyl-diaminopimelate desuccinylase